MDVDDEVKLTDETSGTMPLDTPELHDVIYKRSGWRRWLHGMTELSLTSLWRTSLRIRLQGRFGRLLKDRAFEIARSVLSDIRVGLFGRPPPILSLRYGAAFSATACSIALYVHFSPDGMVSEMVLQQLELYKKLGFQVVFISNAPVLPPVSQERVFPHTACIIHRRNFGFDFGAWKDTLPWAIIQWPETNEALLVNDSCLGPLRPLEPTVQAMRFAGNGVFGMQESLQGGVHLQSWFILARGKAAICDIVAFLRPIRLSISKWKTIQRGELRLARVMLKRGHRVRTIHAYAPLVDAALADKDQRADIKVMLKRKFDLDDNSNDTVRLRRRIMERPLNPMHHLWRTLIKSSHCSFLKTELILKNPGDVPNVASLWKDLVPINSPCPIDVVEAHLKSLLLTTR